MPPTTVVDVVELGFRPLRRSPLAGSSWPVARAASLMLTKQVSTALLTSVLHVHDHVHVSGRAY